jgi:hypothetical protein
LFADNRVPGRTRLRRKGALRECASAVRRGCRENPRLARWIACKGGFRKRPSRLSHTGSPSRARRARRLSRAPPQARCGFSLPALSDSHRPQQEPTESRRECRVHATAAAGRCSATAPITRTRISAGRERRSRVIAPRHVGGAIRRTRCQPVQAGVICPRGRDVMRVSRHYDPMGGGEARLRRQFD